MIYLALVSIIWAFSFGLIGSSLSGVDSFLGCDPAFGGCLVSFSAISANKRVKGKSNG